MIKCRTLTEKSIFWFGKYEGMSLRQAIDLDRFGGISYIAWCYFNNSKFGLNEAMLKEINITENLQIEKPSKKSIFYHQWKIENTDDEQRIGMYHSKNRAIKNKVQSRSRFENRRYTKTSMRDRNQGRS